MSLECQRAPYPGGSNGNTVGQIAAVPGADRPGA